MSPEMAVTLPVALLGLAFGSFLNVCIHRLPAALFLFLALMWPDGSTLLRFAPTSTLLRHEIGFSCVRSSTVKTGQHFALITCIFLVGCLPHNRRAIIHDRLRRNRGHREGMLGHPVLQQPAVRVILGNVREVFR